VAARSAVILGQFEGQKGLLRGTESDKREGASLALPRTHIQLPGTEGDSDASGRGPLTDPTRIRQRRNWNSSLFCCVTVPKVDVGPLAGWRLSAPAPIRTHGVRVYMKLYRAASYAGAQSAIGNILGASRLAVPSVSRAEIRADHVSPLVC
jgi:hypothetical protein